MLSNIFFPLWAFSSYIRIASFAPLWSVKNVKKYIWIHNLEVKNLDSVFQIA